MRGRYSNDLSPRIDIILCAVDVWVLNLTCIETVIQADIDVLILDLFYNRSYEAPKVIVCGCVYLLLSIWAGSGRCTDLRDEGIRKQIQGRRGGSKRKRLNHLNVVKGHWSGPYIGIVGVVEGVGSIEMCV